MPIEKKKCFIIAPISTLEERAPLYLNDIAHCEHVIDHLLAPSVEKAGYEAVKPKAKGANLIHAEIVRNLQTASMVLCDMSGLNPNVFFELGIRTAMNKPICLVIDEATKNPPFDLDLVNHHAYVSDLRPWVLPGEIEKLATHIKESAKMDENALWKYFSLRIAAEPTTTPSDEKTELNLLRMEIEALRRETRASPMTQKTMFTGFTDHDEVADVVRSLYAAAKNLGLSEPKIHIDRHGLVTVTLSKDDWENKQAIVMFTEEANRRGIPMRFASSSS